MKILVQVGFVVQRSRERRHPVAEELGQADFAHAEVGRDHKHTAGSQHAPQLAERNRKLESRQVLQRVEHERACTRFGPERNPAHVGADATDSSVLALDREHPRRKIQRNHRVPPFGEVAADLAGPSPIRLAAASRMRRSTGRLTKSFPKAVT
jgi:hypothetical protein